MPDVNVLVYAHRREDPDHEFYRVWFENLANRAEPFALSILVAAAFVRIITHPAFRPRPTPLPQALAVIDSLVCLDNCVMTESAGNHWPVFKALCEKTGACGKLVADAQHAAMAIEHGCTWVTTDADFDCFRACGLRVEILQP